MAKKKKRPNVELDEPLYNFVKNMGFKFGEIFEDGLYYVLYDPEYSKTLQTVLCNKTRIKDLDKRMKETRKLLKEMEKEKKELIKQQEEYNKAIKEINYYETQNMEKATGEVNDKLKEIKKERKRPLTLESIERIARRNHIPVRALIRQMTRDGQRARFEKYTTGCEIFFYKD